MGLLTRYRAELRQSQNRVANRIPKLLQQPKPESIRRSFSTTNIEEAISGQLEIMRRNSSGYFHSEGILKRTLGLAISSREEERW